MWVDCFTPNGACRLKHSSLCCSFLLVGSLPLWWAACQHAHVLQFLQLKIGESCRQCNTTTDQREHELSGPISRDIAIVSLRYPLSRDTFSAFAAIPQEGAIPPLGAFFLHRHISATPHFATYRAIFVRYPRKTSTKTFCDTIAQSIARYAKNRYWAS